MALCGKVMEPLGYGILLEEVHGWEWGSSLTSLPVLSLLPACACPEQNLSAPCSGHLYALVLGTINQCELFLQEVASGRGILSQQEKSSGYKRRLVSLIP